MLPFRRSVGSSIKKVFIINSLCCLKAFPYLFSKQKLLKQKILETCQVFSFDRLYLITFRAKNTQKLTLLTYFTIIERKQAKWTKSIGALYNVWKSFPSGSLYEQYWHKRIRLLTPLATPWVFYVFGEWGPSWPVFSISKILRDLFKLSLQLSIILKRLSRNKNIFIYSGAI